MTKLCRLFVTFVYIITLCSCNVHSDDRNGDATSKPNIVMIIADDLGWDDVSFHGSSQVWTPNIDMLAYTGVALERYYSHCVCTPSRTAILTGKFAHTLGMNGYPLTLGEDRGLPLSEKLLPEYLKELGYATNLVGKWHVGHSRDEYLPTSRGFDSHFGFRGGSVDYYEYVAEETWSQGSISGFDLYRNKTPAWDVEGYLTDVLTDKAVETIRSHGNIHQESAPLFLMVTYSGPHAGNEGAILQAPPETVRAMRHIENPHRRMFAAMTKKVDDGVGSIVKALSEEGMLNNSIVVFISDNGGMPVGSVMNYASNLPLRGPKGSPLEGGIRVVGLLWTPTLNVTNNPNDQYFHAVDWLPTLLKAANGEIPTNIDGINLWDDIVTDKLTQSSTRQDIFEIYTCSEDSFSAVVSGDFKLITGNVTKKYSAHLGKDLRGIIGVAPNYTKIIENSVVYKLLERKDNIVNFENLRNHFLVSCGDIEENRELCNTGPQGQNYCLYNIKKDPCELEDLSMKHPDILAKLLFRLQNEMKRAIDRPCPEFRDPRALPSLHNYTWTTWANGLP